MTIISQHHACYFCIPADLGGGGHYIVINRKWHVVIQDRSNKHLIQEKRLKFGFENWPYRWLPKTMAVKCRFSVLQQFLKFSQFFSILPFQIDELWICLLYLFHEILPPAENMSKFLHKIVHFLFSNEQSVYNKEFSIVKQLQILKCFHIPEKPYQSIWVVSQW